MSRCIMELVRPARAVPLHYKTYQKSRDNCKVHNMRLRSINKIIDLNEQAGPR
jgi:hypothetical protein